MNGANPCAPPNHSAGRILLRPILAAAVALLLALALVGCTATETPPASDNAVEASTAAPANAPAGATVRDAQAVAAAGDGNQPSHVAPAMDTTAQAGPPTLRVSATGRASAAPDLAIATIGVDVSEPTVAAAATRAAELMADVIAALQQAGVAESDIQTSEYGIHPEWDYSRDRARLRGYRVVSAVTVQIRDVDNTGAVLQTATAAGGDDTVIRNLTLTFQNPEPLRDQARASAIREVRRKAEQMAGAAGMEIDALVTLDEMGPGARPLDFDGAYHGLARMESAATALPPIAAGQSEVAVTVSAVYTLK